MSSNASSWRPVVAPLLFATTAAILTRFVTDRPEEAAAMARGIAGPTTWPTIMLYGVVAFALVWAVQRIAGVLRQSGEPAAAPTSAARGARVWIGIVLVLGYGFSLPVLGFAIATVVYVALWLLLGGVRSALQVSLISIIGTAIFLYFFVKVALMPLDRGVGAIGELSIALYRLMGIY